jgi:predicted nuclease of predicted toxin-antitoxin system
MTIWIDAQLSPALAAWINRTFEDLDARSVRSLGLRDAADQEIWDAAQAADVVVMTKDSDFLRLLDRHGPPPKVVWITCGNTSNQRIRDILSQLLPGAVRLLQGGEPLVEIGDAS